MSNSNGKKQLVRKLLNTEGYNHRTKRVKKKKNDIKEQYYDGKDDPENPENEINFKKAYKKLAGKFSEEKNNILLNTEELEDDDEDEDEDEERKIVILI